jgi:hypothetical protein
MAEVRIWPGNGSSRLPNAVIQSRNFRVTPVAFDSQPSPASGYRRSTSKNKKLMMVLKLSTTPFAIYRHQAKIFIVPSDGPIEMAAERFFIRQ